MMDNYYLTREEEEVLQGAILLPNMRLLYDYFYKLPLEDLQAYPKRGYRERMGPEALSPKALEMRDYILFWRLAAKQIRKQYSRAYLKTLSQEQLCSLQKSFYRQIPLWAYDKTIGDIILLLKSQ